LEPEAWCSKNRSAEPLPRGALSYLNEEAWDMIGNHRTVTLGSRGKKSKLNLSGTIRAASFSLNGQRLITNLQGNHFGPGSPPAIPRGIAEVWDVGSSEKVCELIPISELEGRAWGSAVFRTLIESVALSPSGDKALLGLNDGTAVLYEVDSETKLAILRHPDEAPGFSKILALKFSSDSNTAMVGFEREVIGWSLDTLQPTFHLRAATLPRTSSKECSSVCGIHMSEDRQYLFAWCEDGASYLWNLETGAVIREAANFHCSVVGISTGGSALRWATSDGLVRDSSGVILDTKAYRQKVFFSDNGAELVSLRRPQTGASSQDQALCEWVGENSEVRVLGTFHPNAAHFCERVIKCTEAGWLAPYSVKEARLYRQEDHVSYKMEGTVRDAAVAGENVVLCSQLDDYSFLLRWFKLDCGEVLGQIHLPQNSAWDLDGKILACSHDNQLWVSELDNFDRIWFPGGGCKLFPIIVSGSRIIGQESSKLHVFEIGVRTITFSFTIESEHHGRIAKLGGDRILWTSPFGGDARVFSLLDGAELVRFNLQPGLVKVLRDQYRILAVPQGGFKSAVIEEWCLKTGEKLSETRAQDDWPQWLDETEKRLPVWNWPGGPYSQIKQVSPDHDRGVSRSVLYSLTEMRELAVLNLKDIVCVHFRTDGIVALTANGNISILSYQPHPPQEIDSSAATREDRSAQGSLNESRPAHPVPPEERLQFHKEIRSVGGFVFEA